MGRIRDQQNNGTCSTLNEALLLTTMSIIGLPVDVYIKDGSIFSGIFHTASFDNGYGIALKKARMIKKGTQNPNVLNGGIIDTLVVLPGDLVQVVAKGLMLPADHGSNCATCDDEGTVARSIDVSRESTNGYLCNDGNQERQVGRVAMPEEYEDSCLKASNEVPKVNGSKISLNNSYSKLNVDKENHEEMSLNHLPNGSSSGVLSVDAKHVNQLHDKESTCTESVASENSSSSKTELDLFRNALAVPIEIAPQNPLSNRAAKESKLNPSAKVFSPSFPNFRSTPPLVQTAPSVAYVSNSIPAVQIAGAQPEVGIQPIVQRQPWPVKFVPYVTSTAMSADNGLQYSQPIAGPTHVVTRGQPMRNGAHYQPIQAMPPYVHPNPQNGIFGRPGQLVYVHPVTHDVIQNPTTLSQGSHPIHVGIAKNEGLLAGQALPVSVTPPPLIASGLQPFTMPNHIHLSQPLFSSMHPIPILGPNIPYSAKYP